MSASRLHNMSPDEWASWILMGDPDMRWPVTLNELAKRIKEAIKIIRRRNPMNFTYEATYEDCSPDGTVVVSAEVRFTYTVIWGCPARIRYDECDHPAEGDELTIIKTEIERIKNYLAVTVMLEWTEASRDEHEILCSWVNSSSLGEEMLESAREQEASAKDEARELAAEDKVDFNPREEPC